MERVFTVVGHMLGAHRVRCTHCGMGEALLDQPFEGGGLSEADEAAKGALAVRGGGVEQDTGHRVRAGSGVDALTDAGRPVAALQRHLSHQQMAKRVQG